MGITEDPAPAPDDPLGPTLAGPPSDPAARTPSTASARAAARAATDTPLGSTIDRHRAIELEEHAADVLRLRHALTFGLLAWAVVYPLDLYVVTHVEPGSPWRFLAYRLVGGAPALIVILLLLRAPPRGRWALRACDAIAFGGVCVAMGLMCVDFRGFESPYAAGFHVALMCRGAFLAQRWRDALLANGVIFGTYPAVLLASTLVSERMAAQAADPATLGVLAVYTILLSATMVLAVIGGHLVWSLRRQVFEARNVGRYRMVRPIGKGGMGEVWAAHHPSLKRDVALKILRPGLDGDGVALRRFEREVQATTELTHPNTVRIFDYGVTPEGLWYYAMELLDGGDLDALVRREGPLPPERARRILLQASRALAEAHARGIVHRDIKPHNVFITAAVGAPDFVKVLDFGIAKVARDEMDATLTAAGWVGGTPAYMSPEAAAGGDTDARADVYSLGATLYYALTGAPPFDGKTLAAVIAAHERAAPRPPSERLGRPLHPAIDAIVLRCLAKAPADRYPDAGELAAALDAARWDAAPGNELASAAR